ncbi:hypothetical protein ACWEQL_38915 [Kitasatospora sp. NPDC004240]
MTETVTIRRAWWEAPANSTIVYIVLLMVLLPLRGFAEMATDPCSYGTDCPSTFAHLAVADRALLSAVALIVLQWPVAYLLPRGRLALSLAPGAAMLTMLIAVLTIEAGT